MPPPSLDIWLGGGVSCSLSQDQLSEDVIGFVHKHHSSTVMGD